MPSAGLGVFSLQHGQQRDKTRCMGSALILENVQEGAWSVYAVLSTAEIEKGEYHGNCDNEERDNGAYQLVR
jgi:hypothetical protein